VGWEHGANIRSGSGAWTQGRVRAVHCLCVGRVTACLKVRGWAMHLTAALGETNGVEVVIKATIPALDSPQSRLHEGAVRLTPRIEIDVCY
jgi:hypothetical protein